jgi:hypothetical protein
VFPKLWLLLPQNPKACLNSCSTGYLVQFAKICVPIILLLRTTTPAKPSAHPHQTQVRKKRIHIQNQRFDFCAQDKLKQALARSGVETKPLRM